ncbi:MAG TPA: mechanosensitive ion channel domain-containing protein [Anaeromyxobacteraceae bacterium]|nr:mechanosensitive ion channel domain-containing protein [Anaeromyxobacteraceae bacterium]
MPIALAVLERWLPPQLLRSGPLDIAWWQWLAIPGVLVLAWMAGKVLGWATRRILGRLAARTTTRWDDVLLARLGAPLTFFWSIAAAWLLKMPLEFSAAAEARVDRVLRVAVVATLFWGGVRAVDVGFLVLAETPTARASGIGRGLLPMLRKATQIAVLAMAVVAVLTDLGYPVASLLAGLGIGGLALAFAAQKTLENLFGSISISIDRPFQVGDFVKVEGGLQGTVEDLGLRSTRIRTLDRTVVTVPNGKLADQRIETFAPRDRCRLNFTMGLVYATSAAQMREVLGGVEALLRGHPRVWPEGISVRFVGLSASTLDVELAAWFDTADWNEFQAIRQDVLLAVMEVVERAGTAFAFPTQTIELAGEGGDGVPAAGGEGERAPARRPG